jgi:hypothetical protein
MRGVSPTGREEWGDEEEGGGEKPRENLGRAGGDKGNIGGRRQFQPPSDSYRTATGLFLRKLVLV